jgi:hypothetical protein
MTKVALALGSFIVGVCCASLVFAVSQASARAQLPVAIAGGNTEPVVPPLSLHLSNFSLSGGFVQPLDGIDCDGCLLSVARLSYAGGAYRLKNTRIPNGIPIELKGAALNTVNLLRQLGAFSNSQQPLPSSPTPTPTPPASPTPPPKAAPKNELEIKPQSNFTIVSLEGLQK